MDVEAEPVPEAVAERARERARVDDAARERVRVDAGDAGADAVERRLLRAQHGVVRLLRLAVDRPGRERPRVVGRVAADRRARVDDDELAGADLAVACTRVRARAGRPGADDRLEREALAALLVEELLEIPGDLALRAPDERHLGQPLEDAVGDRARLAQLLELGSPP